MDLKWMHRSVCPNGQIKLQIVNLIYSFLKSESIWKASGNQWCDHLASSSVVIIYFQFKKEIRVSILLVCVCFSSACSQLAECVCAQMFVWAFEWVHVCVDIWKHKSHVPNLDNWDFEVSRLSGSPKNENSVNSSASTAVQKNISGASQQSGVPAFS